MPDRMRRTEKTEDTRRKLLAAARRVFLRLGFHNSSLDQVAEEAGFTKGVVYSRFASKADLFLAILEERIEQRIVEMRTAVASLEGLLAVATVLSRQWDERLRQDEQWSLLLIEFRLHAARRRPGEAGPSEPVRRNCGHACLGRRILYRQCFRRQEPRQREWQHPYSFARGTHAAG